MRFIVLSIIIVPHLYCIIWADERWPYSNYPMYAHVQPDTHSFQAITGFTEDGNKIGLMETQFWGVPWGRIRGAIRSSMRRTKNADRTPDSIAMAILREYERRRVAGLHHGPRVIRVQIETRQWSLSSKAAVGSPPEVIPYADSDGAQKQTDY
jgi:hypothetical protein